MQKDTHTAMTPEQEKICEFVRSIEFPSDKEIADRAKQLFRTCMLEHGYIDEQGRVIYTRGGMKHESDRHLPYVLFGDVPYDCALVEDKKQEEDICS